MPKTVTAIIVTHNSEKFLQECFLKLRSQTHPIDEVIVVDCGSDNSDYVKEFSNDFKITLVLEDNVGFSRANNIGFARSEVSADFVVFLNPDTYLDMKFVEKAIAVMDKMPHVGMLSGRLLGFDPEQNCETGTIDSTGIFRKIYGRWYDRGHNETDHGQFSLDEEVPALCGALLFCRKNALECFSGNIFDDDFFLYKEDIELSIRMRKQGWTLLYSPKLVAYHCRGWRSRTEIPFILRKKAAESEILLYKKHPSPYIIWALFKYVIAVFLRQ